MDKLTEVWNRLRGLARRRQIERELEEEMSFHIEMKTRELVEAGMSEEQARRAARRVFGNRALLEEDSRGAWRFVLLETTLQDVRYGTRTLLRNPLFAAAVVMTLALGIGANTAIFSLLDSVALRPLPVQSPEELYVFGSRYSMTTIQADGVAERNPDFFSHPLYRDFREHGTTFSDLAAFSSWPVDVHLTPDEASPGVSAQRALAWLVSGNFFETLGVQAALGRALTSEDDRTPGAHPVVVLSHAFWARRFGQDEDVIGRPLRMNGMEYTVLGVTPPGFRGVTVGLDTDIWVPLAMQAQLTRGPSDLDDRNILWLRLVGRRQRGIEAEQAAARTNDLFQRMLVKEAGSDLTPDTRQAIARLTTELVPFERGFSGLRRRYARPLLVLMTVVGLLLLIACANVANLLLARAARRGREIAVRLTLGASRSRLVRQLVTESLLLALAGGAVALLVARWTTGFILGLIYSGPVPLDVGIDLRVLGFTLGVSLLTAFLFGLAPARRATRVDLLSTLKSQTGLASAGHRGWSLRQTLVVCQVALSLVLLVGAGLFLRSLDNLRSQDLGFHTEGLLQVDLDPQGGGYEAAQLSGLYQDLVEGIEALPAVESASLSSFSLLSGSRTRNEVFVDGYAPRTDEDRRIEQTVVTPGYFETIGARPLLGRPAEERDRQGAPRVALVNQSFARHYFGDESPLGRRFGVDGESSSRDFEIVGLMKNLKYNDLWADPARLVYFPFAQQGGYLHALQVRSREDLATVAAASQVRRLVSKVAPDLPILAIRSLTQEIDLSLRQEKLLSRLTGFFGLLALLLASIGLYGVLAYGVSQRTSEIGIRMALGAPRLRVLWMVLRSAMVWASIGVAIGALGALAAGRLVSSLLFGLAPTDPATILLAATVLLLVAAFAGYWPARRASRLDPVIALRCE